ncbi:hypothetical protein PFISCL1PPCAC_21850 [Pristionchus fissidentatus]|uniref:Glycosyltransferase 2-like domain-containing protein n=1 Tax=Pristionchus fissidentatus TaxID=1538716 RepID=A0AAV5WJR4_9BILA|nr:hypothetical protein PFISCL1PPCAC_21850 [Pristionchus fissidentatus]
MSGQIDVSCVIPVKNGGAYLIECLDSLLAQHFDGSYEICVYDDGSTDGTWRTVEKYEAACAAAGIGFRSGRGATSGGVGFAKNRAVQLARGRFLCFCDADDMSHPERLEMSMSAALSLANPSRAFVGTQCTRLPEGSTERFIRWANEMTEERLYEQIFTSHGPTLLTPTWFVARALFERTGGFNEQHVKGYPEDLDLYYRAIDAGAILHKVAAPLLTYRYHAGCETLAVSEKTIWTMRLAELERRKLRDWPHFTIWSAGKQGKLLYKCLSSVSKGAVRAFCDVDARKIGRGVHEEYDERERRVTARVPIVDIRDAVPPFVICVKQDLTGGDLEAFIAEKRLVEGTDYVHFG